MEGIDGIFNIGGVNIKSDLVAGFSERKNSGKRTGVFDVELKNGTKLSFKRDDFLFLDITPTITGDLYGDISFINFDHFSVNNNLIIYDGKVNDQYVLTNCIRPGIFLKEGGGEDSVHMESCTEPYVEIPQKSRDRKNMRITVIEKDTRHLYEDEKSNKGQTYFFDSKGKLDFPIYPFF